MIDLPDLKKYYVKMYEEIRNYIWDFNTVECLAELEVSVYRRFPDLSEIRNKFNRFYLCISNICEDDEELNNAVISFKNLINSTNQTYARIIQPQEV